MESMIEARSLTKMFGNKSALRSLDFVVYTGETFGFLGPSGSGKTTTIKILTAQLLPTSGTARVFGQDVAQMTEAERCHHWSRIGILTDNSALYDRLSVQDNLELFCKLYQVPASRVPEALEQVNLADDRQTIVKNLSKGLKQRVTLARALLHRPKILFLDEPTSALDPGNTRRIHESLKELNRAGTTIFLSTHDMEEAETLCDRIAFLHQGRISAMDTPLLLRRRYADATITVTTVDGSYQVACDEEGARRVSETMTSGKLVSIHSNEPSLSDIFIKVTGGAVL
ncbi:bacitracin ABC transporter ATP-binding protein [Paenibacillus dendritiformis]|uniref:ABC transporter ATP-binding protein n=1 Tax=Paenibacillus dendritiformis TaxID=130049 RepID=UPI0018CC9BA1|nr:ABC transporter ATP-binding protein [Paenibacillus dendritiformis]MBG9791686.1 bacitracin ABC transporter ATP-binding protein [Paenibacillus dendritiformis]